MDLTAMRTKDSGMVVEDDYSNIERLVEEKIITSEEGGLLKKFNGIRNAIAHKYGRLDMKIIAEALGRIDELSEAVLNICDRKSRKGRP